ncbi:uncharacterized protein LY89DRAFT_787913 [Mollisia scopiformis]|uniref:Uncharacterized protein n=1 Tax=Mollisia scopiformis TaxID=149040 RepID=A0A132BB36_MOLSC|nr:uncharacterized protein LY89DRAFT_787913 [Mollisia scopiformis]KUJ09625.1 hypothetical protein LY89DRAFT_787913 [Mollisia scopiformis]
MVGQARQAAQAAQIQRIYYDTRGDLLPPNKRQEYTQNLTDLAKKYTHPLGKTGAADHRILFNTGKSGITPISSPPPCLIETDQQKLSRNQLKAYQKTRFRGFTTAELKELNALEPLDFETHKNELTNIDIHPAFRRKRWLTEKDLPKHLGVPPILGGLDGLWEVTNPVVWAVVKPCLQMASMMLMNEYEYGWLDALFRGRLEKFAKDKGKQLLRLHPRTGLEMRTDSAADEIQKFFERKISKKIDLRIDSGYSVMTGMPIVTNPLSGVTYERPLDPGIHVSLSLEMFEPLLRTDLTDAERLGNTWNVAKTLVHEMAHATWRALKRYKPPYAEPYFDDQALSELGFSFINDICGGEPARMLRRPYWSGGPGVPQLGIWSNYWFNSTNAGYTTSAGAPPQNKPVEPDEIDPFYTRDDWVVPTSWHCNMFLNNWWNVGVVKFSREFTHMGPLQHGYRKIDKRAIEAGNIEPRKIRVGEGDGTGLLYSEGPGDRIVISDKLSIANRKAIYAEQKRMVEAGKILFALTKNPGYVGAPNDNTDNGERPPRIQYQCRRWDEIVAYLFANRGPKELALDTMTLLSEPQFYRYIRGRGGINLTGLEFREFLAVANERGILFVWEAHPGRGLVIRRKEGWPPAQDYPLEEIDQPSDEAVELDTLLSDEGTAGVPAKAAIPAKPAENGAPAVPSVPATPAVKAVLGTQGKIFRDFGVNRDVDVKIFWEFLYKEDPTTWDIPLDRLIEVVDESINLGSMYITHGPEGIVRFIYDVPDHVWEAATPFAKTRVADMKKRAGL